MPRASGCDACSPSPTTTRCTTTWWPTARCGSCITGSGIALVAPSSTGPGGTPGEAYERVNHQFARVLADEVADGGTVLVQDYHLSLVCGDLAKLRPDLRTAFFAHTPFCTPEELAVLPDEVAHQRPRRVGRRRRLRFPHPPVGVGVRRVLRRAPGAGAGHLRVPRRAGCGRPAPGGRLRGVRPRARRTRPADRRAAPDRARRSHRAVEEPAPGLRRLR